jgi:hypothetical protein
MMGNFDFEKLSDLSVTYGSDLFDGLMHIKLKQSLCENNGFEYEHPCHEAYKSEFIKFDKKKLSLSFYNNSCELQYIERFNDIDDVFYYLLGIGSDYINDFENILNRIQG